jgi:hypothetical protein
VTLLNPWGLLALGGLAVVGVIYLFYERYREKMVSALFLWDAPEAWREGGRRLARPRATRSLLLDLLAALALGLAVAAPAWVTRAGLCTAVVLDSSLSMRALDNHHETRALARDLISGGASFLVVEAGARPRVLAGPGADARTARASLDAYDPHDPADSLPDALTLARELVSGHARVHVITDHDAHLPPPPSGTLTVHVLEARAPNPALLEATRHRSATGETLIVVAAGHAPSAVTARLAVTSGGEILHERELTLGPQQTEQLTLELPPGTGRFDVSLHAPRDALEADSTAVLLPEPPRVVAAAVHLDDPAVAADVRRALRAAHAVTNEDAPDLLVTSGEGRGAVLTLTIPPGDTPSRPAFLGPYVVDGTHPLCRDLDLTGVYWTPTAGEPAGTPPLVSVGQEALYGFSSPDSLVLSLDPSRSNITRTAAWPVLLSNLVLLAAERLPGLRRANYLPAEIPGFVPFDDPERNPERLTGPGTDTPWRAGAAPPRLPSRPGVYVLSTPSGDDHRLSVNAIAPAESDLTDLAADTHELRSQEAGVRAGGVQPLRLGFALVLVAALAMLANWLLDRRRSA